MKVFVTGATGFIGSATVQELIQSGHEVIGLARSDAGAELLKLAGAQVHRGSLEDLESLKSGVALADGVIHTAFIHDFSNFAGSCEAEKQALLAIGEELKGSSRPLVVTSGVALLALGRVATEQHSPPPVSDSYPRPSEAMSNALAAEGVRSSVIRLAPSVHGEGDHGFVPYLIGIAKAKGVSAYIGEGHNRWPGVHRFDAARLYRLAIEKGETGGRFHGIADEGVPTKAIAEVIGRRLGLPVVSKSPQEAPEHFGWMAFFFGMDVPASSLQTQEQLGWKPSHLGLLEDLDQPYYFL